MVGIAFGLREGLDAEQRREVAERMGADVGARYSNVLAETLHAWAVTADSDAGVDQLARAVVACIVTSAPGLSETDAPALLAQMRAAVHRNGG
ncbi:hypothetical protein P3T36_006437 [Kitasatospora sp. MAP12-15]|uniref:hypothetical protein n=1 Tax=unclassified Kitasatospora TaxID=2633591 RepID=UPI0024772A79|nr:hypothetical protein [Kitasatospora sp. MAP12-44]MDH6107825.1 hypothetical protein [Kitasatospora sp. MAP12-44]